MVDADHEGVDIQFTPTDADGEPVGEPAVQHSTWIELRDHASFPAARSTREWVARQSELGLLDGWLYTVRDDAAGTVTEFFFAESLPGAPVHMLVIAGEETVMEMQQLRRNRPAP